MTSLKKDPSGRRTVELEVEVPGTPEQVWHAIATGPGVSSWFAAAEIEGRVGGRIAVQMGPGMESASTITAWDPPRRFAAESSDMPGAPPMATEWSIATRGGTCVVRIVHSLFASSDDWDDQLTSLESGWPTYFAILRLYLAHFAGQPVATIQGLAIAQGTDAALWDSLGGGLGLLGARLGQSVRSPGAGAPAFAGVVEQLGSTQHPHQLTLKLEQPAPGLALIGAFDCHGMTMATLCLHLFGNDAAAIAAREEPVWQAWLAERFPAPPMPAADSAAHGATSSPP